MVEDRVQIQVEGAEFKKAELEFLKSLWGLGTEEE
jgi:hypothetical protein